MYERYLAETLVHDSPDNNVWAFAIKFIGFLLQLQCLTPLSRQ